MGTALFQGDTTRLLALLLLAQGGAVLAQTRADWRSVGSVTVDWSSAGLELAGPASGPIDRVAWDGDRLLVQTRSGRIFATSDGESWKSVSAMPAVPGVANETRRYQIEKGLRRSDDGGLSWRNLTDFEGRSILGPNLRAVAADPANADRIAVASDFGVWRSVDGGLTWMSANSGLPNFNIRQIHRVPENGRGLLIETNSLLTGLEWLPGEKNSWRAVGAVADDPVRISAQRRQDWANALQSSITAAALAGRFGYAGSGDGRLFTNPDVESANWRPAPQNFGGPVVSIAVDASDPLTALAVVAADRGPRVWRTLNGGLVWDDLTADLPPGAAHGAAFEKESGAIYLATDAGLFWTSGNLQARAPATSWTRIEGAWPGDLPVYDAKLNRSGTQLFVAVEGHGVFAAVAPHRQADPRLVSAADYVRRAAAPGTLLSLVGARATAARAGDRTIPILPSTDSESQLQIPFDLDGNTVAIQFQAGRPLDLRLPLEATAPAIFEDRDGTPMLIDADSGVLIDAGAAVRPGMRLQILATGLGKVDPAWPAGVPAPLNDTPRVVAPVRVMFDRAPLDVSRATLAPGYVGFYVIEFEVPSIVNAGSTEIFLEVGGRASNRTRITIVP